LRGGVEPVTATAPPVFVTTPPGSNANAMPELVFLLPLRLGLHRVRGVEPATAPPVLVTTPPVLVEPVAGALSQAVVLHGLPPLERVPVASQGAGRGAKGQEAPPLLSLH